ncbi:MAG: DUF72 domain-containing protein [Elusimicrobiota bacterium]|nr:DUF72 domain-containing protein [Elusimicrobiota bacterium]
MIRIGTSGFSFPDWRGVVYPENIQPKDALPYYEQELGFNTVEINFTYYTLPGLKTMEGLVKKTTEDFDFVVKAFKGMTHDPFDNRLEKRPEITEVKETFEKFLYSMKPMIEKKKLGAVLLQFPVFFYPRPENKDYLLHCKEWLSDVPAVIEFRNRTWAEPETFTFLKDNDLAYCIVDEPKLPRLMPFVEEVTSNIGYLRLHGRNQNWFNVPTSERYNYLYSDKELKEFVDPIKRIHQRAQRGYVFFNNCHAGSAARNALQMKSFLKDIVEMGEKTKELLKKAFLPEQRDFFEEEKQ